MNRWGLFPQHFGLESELFRNFFHRWLGVSFISLNGQIRQENHTRPLSSTRFLFFDYCYFYWDTQREPLRRRETQDAKPHPN